MNSYAATLSERTNSNQLMNVTRELMAVAASVTGQQNLVYNKQNQLANQHFEIESQKLLVQNALHDKQGAGYDNMQAQRAYREAGGYGWKRMCYATRWIPFVGIVTCIRALETEELKAKAAEFKFKFNARRYDLLMNNLVAMVDRTTKFVADLHDSKVQLQKFKDSLVVLNRKKIMLDGQARTLSSLGPQIQSTVRQMAEIGADHNAFIERNVSGRFVSTQLHSFSTLIRRTVAGIKWFQDGLCIHPHDITKLESAADSFNQKMATIDVTYNDE